MAAGSRYESGADIISPVARCEIMMKFDVVYIRQDEAPEIFGAYRYHFQVLNIQHTVTSAVSLHVALQSWNVTLITASVTLVYNIFRIGRLSALCAAKHTNLVYNHFE